MKPNDVHSHDDEIDPLADTERTPTWFPPDEGGEEADDDGADDDARAA